MEVAPTHPKAMLNGKMLRKAGPPALALYFFFLNIEWGGGGTKGESCPDQSLRSLARRGRTPNVSLFAHVFAHFQYFLFSIKIIDSPEVLHPRPTATEILFMPVKCRVLKILSHIGFQDPT